ncbi:MAG: hypothetical protein JWO93_2684 [Micrococcaceae bacterium]|nr:hypothetical protein [Micrococcaceae bacterium]
MRPSRAANSATRCRHRRRCSRRPCQPIVVQGSRQQKFPRPPAVEGWRPCCDEDQPHTGLYRAGHAPSLRQRGEVNKTARCSQRRPHRLAGPRRYRWGRLTTPGAATSQRMDRSLPHCAGETPSLTGAASPLRPRSIAGSRRTRGRCCTRRGFYRPGGRSSPDGRSLSGTVPPTRFTPSGTRPRQGQGLTR